MLEISCGRLEGVWLEGVSKVSGWCLEGIYGMSKWYVRCLDVSKGNSGLVKLEQVKSRLVK